MEGGEAGRGESNFLLPLDCIYRLPLLAPFPERCHRPLGRLRAPFLHPPLPGSRGCRSGGVACTGAGGSAHGRMRVATASSGKGGGRTRWRRVCACVCMRERGKGGRGCLSPKSETSHGVRGRGAGQGGGVRPARSLGRRGQLSGITCTVVCITDTHKFNKLINRILSCRLPLMVPIRATSRPFDL